MGGLVGGWLGGWVVGWVGEWVCVGGRSMYQVICYPTVIFSLLVLQRCDVPHSLAVRVNH